jgi:hypothetical protein
VITPLKVIELAVVADVWPECPDNQGYRAATRRGCGKAERRQGALCASASASGAVPA